MKRLSIADGNIVGAHTDRVEHIFPPPAVALATLSSLVYLDFLHGTTIADWRYLLTAASRPCFAAQLTHLALRMQWEDREAVAVLLPRCLSCTRC